MNFITDVHVHYDDPAFDNDRDSVLRRLNANGVSLIINSGSEVPSSERSVRLAESYDFVWASVGVFPLEAYSVPENWLSEIERLARHEKVVAIGEIGLDYREGNERKAEQEEVFVPQIDLANRLSLPVVIHDCEADEDFLRIFDARPFRGMIHRFFSEVKYGRMILERGLSLGIGPQITYPNSDKLIQIVKEMPADRILLETDGPYLPTYPNNVRATSDMIEEVCVKIAEVRGDMTPQEVAIVAYENAKKLFSIK